MIKNLLRVAGLAVGLALATGVRAQTVGTITYATNAVPQSATYNGFSSPFSTIGNSRCTLYGYSQALSNTVAPGFGVGTLVFPVYGSPDPLGNGTLTNFYSTSNSLVLTFNGTNAVTGSMTFDTVGMQSACLGPVQNTATNGIGTNFNGNIRFFFK